VLFLDHCFFNEIYNLNSKLEYIIIYLNELLITQCLFIYYLI